MKHPLTLLIVAAALIAGCSPTASASLPEEDDETVATTAVTVTPEPTTTTTPSPDVIPTQEGIATAQSGDVTATLEWLYIDAQRVVFTASLYHLPDEIVHADPEDLHFMITPMLYDVAGDLIDASTGGGGQPTWDAGALTVTRDLVLASPLPSEGRLDMALALTVSEETAAGFNTLHALRFPIQVQPIAAHIVDVNQTQAVNGIKLTLKTVTLTPSMMSLTLCYDIPPDAMNWQPETTLSLDWMRHATTYISAEGTEDQCVKQGFIRVPAYDGKHYEIFTPLDAESVTIRVDRLVSYPPEALTEAHKAKADQRLAAQGIEVAFNLTNPAMGWTLMKAPEGMTEDEIGSLVVDALSDFYDGPWEFSIPLP